MNIATPDDPPPDSEPDAAASSALLPRDERFVGDLDLMQPFTVAMAERVGLRPHQLKRPRFRAIMHGIHIDARIPDTLVVRCRAGLLAAPVGGVVALQSASRLWSGSVEDSPVTHLAYSRDVRNSRRDVRLHRYRYRLDVTHRHGLPVTTPGMTFMQLAVHHDLIQLVALGDQFVRRNVISPGELLSYAEGWEHHGRRAGIQAARLVRDRVDSPRESAVRMLLVLAGFPEPDIDVHIHRVDGTVRYRIELAYRALKIAIEYDGRWHEEPEQRLKDAARRTVLTDEEGWLFVVITGDALYGDPEGVLRRVAEAISERGGVPPEIFSDDWRRWFGRVRVS